MARPLRIEFSGALYHVTSRGDRREPIFEDDEDRRMFLRTLAEVVERCNWLCHAYCLKTNDYHLVVETPVNGCINPRIYGEHITVGMASTTEGAPTSTFLFAQAI